MRIDIGSTVLHADVRGEGQTIILLPPGPGPDASVFFPFFDRLAARARVVALDPRGLGRSEEADPADWTLAQAADDARAAAEALGVAGDYTLLGHSFGGMVALTHALAFPGHAAGLVISASVADETVFAGLEERLDAFGGGVKAAFEREGSIRTEAEAREVWVDQLPFFVAEPGGEGEKAMAAALRAASHSVPAVLHPGWGDLDLGARLGEIRVPTLVLAGAQDRMFPPEAVGAVAAGIPGARLAVIEGAGHFAFAEQPDAYFAALQAWLAR